jgi:hypothetical protein
MNKNIGSGERSMRSLVGAGLASAALLLELEPGWAALAFFAGLILLGTALASYCPFNAALGRGRSRRGLD